MDFLNPSLDASLHDLKSIYRILNEHHAEEMSDNGFFASLRELLLDQAADEGVDVHDESAWIAWLSEPPGGPSTPPRELMN